RRDRRRGVRRRRLGVLAPPAEDPQRGARADRRPGDGRRRYAGRDDRREPFGPLSDTLSRGGDSGVIHPDSELRFINPVIGYGLFATSLIRKGTLTWVRDDLDQIVSPNLQDSLPPLLAAQLHKYSYVEPR